MLAVAASSCGTVRGYVEQLAGDFTAAEVALRHSCEILEQTRDRAHLATQAGELAAVLFAQGRYDEAASWIAVAEAQSASDDVSAQVSWRGVRAKILSHQGETALARTLGEEASRLSERTDALNQRAQLLLDLSEVSRVSGNTAEATAHLKAALHLYERKGNLAAAESTRTRLAEPLLA